MKFSLHEHHSCQVIWEMLVEKSLYDQQQHYSLQTQQLWWGHAERKKNI